MSREKPLKGGSREKESEKEKETDLKESHKTVKEELK